MMEIFQWWGRVEEVFISNKLNRWGSRFGFVRFCNVKNVPKLESELDSIRIGNMKLFANLPRYRKHEFPHTTVQATVHPPVKVNQEPKSQKPDLEWKTIQQWKMKEGNRSKVQRNIINNFSNAVAKPGKLEWKGKIISSEPLKLSWLQGSWVGTMGDYMPLSVLREDMLHERLYQSEVLR